MSTKYTIEDLIRMASDKDVSVREKSAENPRTPLETLSLLSRDSAPLVRMEVAKNKNVSEEILIYLSNDESLEVKQRVAIHEKTPEKVWKRLYHENADIKYFVLSKRNLPDTFIEELIDRNEMINEAEAKSILSENPYLSESIYQKYFKGNEFQGGVAMFNLNAEILSDIYETDANNLDVWYGLAENNYIPPEILEKIANAILADDDRTLFLDENNEVDDYLFWQIIHCIARNANTPISVLGKLIEKDYCLEILASKKKIPAKYFDKFASSDKVSVRRSIARNSKISKRLLAILADDEAIEVRKNVAKNSKTGEDILKKLSVDTSLVVRRIALKRLS